MIILLILFIVVVATSHLAAHDNDDAAIQRVFEIIDEKNNFDDLFEELSQMLSGGDPQKIEEFKQLLDDEDMNHLRTIVKEDEPKSTNFFNLFVEFFQYAPTVEAKQEAKEREKRHEEELEKLEFLYSGPKYVGGKIGCTKKTYKMLDNRNLDEEDDWGAEDWRRHSKHGNHGSKGQRKWVIETKARKEIRAQKYSYNHFYI